MITFEVNLELLEEIKHERRLKPIIRCPIRRPIKHYFVQILSHELHHLKLGITLLVDLQNLQPIRDEAGY